jgi:hypothetical protein
MQPVIGSGPGQSTYQSIHQSVKSRVRPVPNAPSRLNAGTNECTEPAQCRHKCRGTGDRLKYLPSREKNPGLILGPISAGRSLCKSGPVKMPGSQQNAGLGKSSWQTLHATAAHTAVCCLQRYNTVRIGFAALFVVPRT